MKSTSVTVSIPEDILYLVRTTFSVEESKIDGFIIELLRRACNGQKEKKFHDPVFSPSEELQIEENLKGLGYI